MDELILVDLNDTEIGNIDKKSAHKYGKLHRAFSVFICCGDYMLIQKRNKHKYHSGGLWANACCSHPRVGENIDTAVSRRLKEELGIVCPVTELFDFVYFSEYSNELFEYEYDHVFIGKFDGEINNYDKNEIEELMWIKIDELKVKMLNEPQAFASWFMIAAPEVIRRLENTKGEILN